MKLMKIKGSAGRVYTQQVSGLKSKYKNQFKSCHFGDFLHKYFLTFTTFKLG